VTGSSPEAREVRDCNAADKARDNTEGSDGIIASAGGRGCKALPEVADLMLLAQVRLTVMHDCRPKTSFFCCLGAVPAQGVQCSTERLPFSVSVSNQACSNKAVGLVLHAAAPT
jgi:hypothetical protein